LSTSNGFTGLVHSGHFLFHGCKETLRIEETSEPEGVGSISFHPLVKLLVSFNQIVEPFGECGNNPGNFSTSSIIDPFIGDSGIEDGVDRLHDLCGHDDLTVDGIASINEGLSDDVEDDLHPGDFLRKEDIERH
jgi:hypothetical protein